MNKQVRGIKQVRGRHLRVGMDVMIGPYVAATVREVTPAEDGKTLWVRLSTNDMALVEANEWLDILVGT
jgi:hypothetical protein